MKEKEEEGYDFLADEPAAEAAKASYWSQSYDVLCGMLFVVLLLGAWILGVQIIADGIRDAGQWISQTAANGQVQAYQIFQQERAQTQAQLKAFVEPKERKA